MRLITRKRLAEYGKAYADARGPLGEWAALVTAGRWQSLDDTRRVFPHADEVRVASGRTVAVFNVKGNSYRLVTAIHYDKQRVYVMRFLTHAQYNKNAWKGRL